MSYKTYTTDALVCRASDHNTDDRSFLLFTRELGMLFASARSVRKESSRQRYALQEFSRVRVSLVKGKAGWRIGSIESQKNYYHAAVDKAARGSAVSLFRLLQRFLHGEEAQVHLFDYTEEALEAVSSALKERSFVDTAVAVRVLGELGYVDGKMVPEVLVSLSPKELDNEYNDEVNLVISKLYAQAVTASHL